jgi:hypothetical protein
MQEFSAAVAETKKSLDEIHPGLGKLAEVFSRFVKLFTGAEGRKFMDDLLKGALGLSEALISILETIKSIMKSSVGQSIGGAFASNPIGTLLTGLLIKSVASKGLGALTGGLMGTAASGGGGTAVAGGATAGVLGFGTIASTLLTGGLVAATTTAAVVATRNQSKVDALYAKQLENVQKGEALLQDENATRSDFVKALDDLAKDIDAARPKIAGVNVPFSEGGSAGIPGKGNRRIFTEQQLQLNKIDYANLMKSNPTAMREMNIPQTGIEGIDILTNTLKEAAIKFAEIKDTQGIEKALEKLKLDPKMFLTANLYVDGKLLGELKTGILGLNTSSEGTLQSTEAGYSSSQKSTWGGYK